MASSAGPCKSKASEESLPKGSVPPRPPSTESERQYADERSQKDLVMPFFKHVSMNTLRGIVVDHATYQELGARDPNDDAIASMNRVIRTVLLATHPDKW
eukprot:6207288-Lingulodinium_polyedra.AAC.1